MLAIIMVVSAFGAGIAAASASSDVASAQSTSASDPSVTLANQSSNGSTVTIQNATLPEGGFIAVHNSEYLGPGPSDLTIIATSEYLDPGQHQNVTIDVSNAPPGNYPGVNTTRLNSTQTLVAALYTDSNGNRQYDYVESGGSEDPAVEVDGEPVADFGRVNIPEPEQQYASATFENQRLENNTLTISRAYLPEGGFLTVHNQSYQQTGDPLTSTIGLSGYLPPGNHSNVQVRVLPQSLEQSQTVTLRVTMDTNDNQQYDYVQSGGFNDTGYSGNQSDVVTETAQVQVPGSQSTASVTSTSEGAGFSQATAISDTSSQPDGAVPDNTTATDTADDSGGSLLGDLSIWQIIGGIVLIVVIILLIRVLR